MNEKERRKKFLNNRLDRLSVCVTELEVTANNYYDPMGENLNGWNVLLKSRDNIKKVMEKDYRELHKLQ